MIGIQVEGDRYIVTLPKCTLVMSREEFIQALRRGKLLKRQRARQARTPTPKPRKEDRHA